VNPRTIDARLIRRVDDTLSWPRPAPGVRFRPDGKDVCASSSRKPRWIVAREMPVARSTKPMPPWPRVRASLAAHSRRQRSVNTGASAAYFAWSAPNRTRHGTIRSAAGQQY